MAKEVPAISQGLLEAGPHIQGSSQKHQPAKEKYEVNFYHLSQFHNFGWHLHCQIAY